MCIIAYKPAGTDIEKEVLQECFSRNPDGAGFMYPKASEVMIQKGFFDFESFWKAWHKTEKTYGDSIPYVLHFRISTAGRINYKNSHPHRISPDLAFVHNGILRINVPKKSKISDTVIYRDKFLVDATPDIVDSQTFQRILGDHIGIQNKFVFMDGHGRVSIINESQGHWYNGIWFSNYSYKPATIKISDLSMLKDLAYPYCDICGKELITEDEIADGLCAACLEDDLLNYDSYWTDKDRYDY